MTGSLAGIRVVEVATSVAGPYATQVLGDLGADVVKVERPGRGDDTRAWGPPFWDSESAIFAALNRNKRSLALDLKSAAGLDVLWRLIKSSDVLLQNLRPGSLERMGLTAEAVMAANPRLIYCVMSGFGPEGPKRSEPAYDPLMQAWSGLMSITGEEGRPPVRIPVSILDQGTAMWTVIGVLDALRTRETTERGSLLQTSLLDTALAWMPFQLSGYFISGELPERLGSGAVGIVPYGAFPTADGYIVVVAGNDAQWHSLCHVLGRDDLAASPDYADNPSRVRNRYRLEEEIIREVSKRPRDYWISRLSEAGIAVAPINTLSDVVADPQVMASGMLPHQPHPRIREFRVVNTPIRENTAFPKVTRVPPLLGEQSEEVLRDLRYTNEEIGELIRAKVVALATLGPASGVEREGRSARKEGGR